jgi:hypothetical protein
VFRTSYIVVGAIALAAVLGTVGCSAAAKVTGEPAAAVAAPTTEAPTTEAPTTEAPTTEAPTIEPEATTKAPDRATPKPPPAPKSTPAPKPKPTTEAPAVPACHPSYQGACLDPNASDYDCIGGSGNGPKYTGRVTVVGPDVFDLDRDGDGIGCE